MIILYFLSCSANVGNPDSPFVIQRKDAQDIVDKSPAPGAALPIEPIGLYLIYL